MPDIVEELRHASEHHDSTGYVMEKAANEIARLRKGIQDYLDGDYEPKVKKIDKCPHGRYGYEACEGCIDAWFAKLLDPAK